MEKALNENSARFQDKLESIKGIKAAKGWSMKLCR